MTSHFDETPLQEQKNLWDQRQEDHATSIALSPRKIPKRGVLCFLSARQAEGLASNIYGAVNLDFTLNHLSAAQTLHATMQSFAKIWNGDCVINPDLPRELKVMAWRAAQDNKVNISNFRPSLWDRLKYFDDTKPGGSGGAPSGSTPSAKPSTQTTASPASPPKKVDDDDGGRERTRCNWSRLEEEKAAREKREAEAREKREAEKKQQEKEAARLQQLQIERMLREQQRILREQADNGPDRPHGRGSHGRSMGRGR